MVACAGPALVASQTAQQPSSVGAPSTEVCTTQRSASAQSLTQASTCSAVSVPTPVIPPRSSTPSPRSSPPTHQQFTVHGHFAGPGDRVGPAPNVTVNPNYQPNPCTDHAPLHSRPHSAAQQTSSSPSASDQQIRVLTPSEIMRTLPSLCQENYEPQQPVRTNRIWCGMMLSSFFMILKVKVVRFYFWYLVLLVESIGVILVDTNKKFDYI